MGRTNYSRFYLHLFLVISYCVASLINSSVALASTTEIGEVKIPDMLVMISIMTILSFGVIFGVLVAVLFIY